MIDGARVPRRTIEWLSASPARVLLLGVALALAVAAVVMTVLMQPPLAELTELVRTLALTSILSLGLSFILYRRGLARSPSLSLTLVLAYVWAALLLLVNVLVMAQYMFVNDHDLALSIVLLVFGGIIASTFGVFVAASVSDSLSQLAATAREVAAGNLDARAPVTGRDEVAEVAEAFNEMAAQLEEAAARREEVERLRRDLIAWTSHDLRTPLTSVRAMVEALSDGVVEDPERVQRYYRTIRADVLALNDLIDDLFELAQLQAGGLKLEMARHSIGDLISDALESFRPLASRQDVTMRGEVADRVGPVMMNASRMGRVLANLISNALQHSPAGGTVWVRARPGDGGVYVDVQDSGPGFSADDLPRIFEQFYRGEEARSRATGGAGLGLAIAHAVVEAHHGRIWAENAEEGGAVVGFWLPGNSEHTEVNLL